MGMMFVVLGSLTIINMLVGVLVGVVEAVSACEKEQLLVTSVKLKLLSMLAVSGLDANEDMHISRNEFELLLLNSDAARVIQDVGVDVVGLVDFTDIIFAEADVDGLSFEEFITVVLKFRGTNTATVRDIVDLRKLILRSCAVMDQTFQAIETVLKDLMDQPARERLPDSPCGERIDEKRPTGSESIELPILRHATSPRRKLDLGGPRMKKLLSVPSKTMSF